MPAKRASSSVGPSGFVQIAVEAEIFAGKQLRNVDHAGLAHSETLYRLVRSRSFDTLSLTGDLFHADAHSWHYNAGSRSRSQPQ
jgi:hypothetical protein